MKMMACLGISFMVLAQAHTRQLLLEDAKKFISKDDIKYASNLFQPYPFDSHTFLANETNPYPAEASFWIVDLKFEDKTKAIKICELGNGRYAGFFGYHSLHGPGVIWQRFWRLLELLHIPLWYIGGNFDREVFKKSYTPRNGKTVPSIEHFSPTKKTVVHDFNNQNILTYNGLLVFKNAQTGRQHRDIIAKKFPRVLQLNQATDSFISNKKATNMLFENDIEIMDYKPKFKVYTKNYFPALAQTIINDLGCELFVIKPLSSSQGRGVIIVEKTQLDEILKLILRDREALEAYKNNDSYYFWKQDRSKEFLIEEYAQSKETLVGKKHYDATMRVACFLCNHNGLIRTTFFAAYWKLPAKELGQDGSLTEKHKSKIIPGKACSTRVLPADFTAVSQQLSRVLPRLYSKMLAHYFGETHET